MKKLFRITIWLVAIFIVASVVMIIISPYGKHEGFSQKVVKTTIEIDKPLEEVYKYLGNSANASKWSVYVDHITPMNSDSFPDGAVGSRRRVFCNADEKGRRWDELISENVLNEKRELELYNYHDFPMTANNLATGQKYEAISENKTLLTFSVYFKNHEPSWIEQYKMYLGSFWIKDIFDKNMKNIKMYVEKGN